MSKLLDIKDFLKYEVKSIGLQILRVLRGSSNWYILITFMGILTLLSSYIDADYSISKMNIPFELFLIYLIAAIIVAVYKEWKDGKWRYERRKKYKNITKK